MTLVLLAAVSLLAVVVALRAAWGERAEHERRGLCGTGPALVRRTLDEAATAIPALTRSHLRAAAAPLSVLAFSGARLVSVGPLVRGWWQLAFADGTTLFVLPTDRRACRLKPERAPTVVQAWAACDDGLDLVLAASGWGTRHLRLRDVVVAAGPA